MSIFIRYQHFIPQRFSTRVFGWLSTRQNQAFKNYSIRKFINVYNVNIDEAEITDIKQYPTFNDFFSRRLKPGARPLADFNHFVSPADGFVSAIGHIDDGQIFQAKGHDYSLNDLLAGNTHENDFKDGDFVTCYLSPKDYHRVHAPLGGTVTSMTFVPGKLFSVNAYSVDNIPGLFARNERLIVHMETEHGPMCIILVGALNVGSMFTSWQGVIKSNAKQTWQYPDGIQIERGGEIGGFLMGSTVIVLLPKGWVTWDPALQTGSHIQCGQSLGELSSRIRPSKR